MNIFRRIYKEIKKYNKIIIARHIGPDPDALGSQFALKELIKDKFPKIILDSDNISNIGALIGCHTGEKCLVVSYIGKGRI